MKDFPASRQTDMTTCGPTCLKNILEHWGYKVSESELVRSARTDNRGNSMYALIKTAEQYHLTAEAYSDGTISDLNEDLQLPAIAHIIADKAVEHYVVLYKLDEQHVYLSDPAKGLRTMTKEAFCEEWTGHLLCVSRGKGFKKRRMVGSPLIPFLSVVLSRKKKLIHIMLLSALTLLIGTAPSYYYQVLTNKLIIDGKLLPLICFTALTFGLILAQNLFSMFRQTLLDDVAVETDTEMLLNTVTKVLRLPTSVLRNKSIGDWQARIYEVSSVSSVLCTATLSIAIDSFMAVFGVYLLIRHSAVLFLIVLFASCIYALVTIVSNKRLQKHALQVVEAANQENAYVTEMLNGMTSIKANGMEQICHQKAKTLRQCLNSRKKNYNRVDNYREMLMDMVSGTMEISILAFGAYWILQQKLDLGTVLAFASLSAYFYEPILKLAGLSTQIKEASVSAHRLLDIWNEEGECNCQDSTPVPEGDIELHDVSYAYGYREPIISHLSAKIPSRGITALIGENGAGKSTAAQLLCGLYTPSEGKISIGGTDYARFSPVDLRRHIVYVPQTTFLFKESIRENLLCGNTEITDEEIMDVCRSIGIADQIEELPLGLDTILNENGNDFSGGERQKLALVRALLKHPKCLILDECTSAMDVKSRSRIRALLKSLSNEMTVIMVTHQKEMIDICDQVLLLRKGNTAIQKNVEQITVTPEYLQIWE